MYLQTSASYPLFRPLFLVINWAKTEPCVCIFLRQKQKSSGRASVCDVTHLPLSFTLNAQNRDNIIYYMQSNEKKHHTVNNPVPNSGVISAHIDSYVFIACIDLCILIAYIDPCLSVGCIYRCISMAYIDQLILIGVYRSFYRLAFIDKRLSIPYMD